VFVVDEDSNDVSVISDANNTMVATVPVGENPYGITYNSDNGNTYVSNMGQGTISIISPGGSSNPVSLFSGTVLYVTVLVVVAVVAIMIVLLHKRMKKGGARPSPTPAKGEPNELRPDSPKPPHLPPPNQPPPEAQVVSRPPPGT
jgi:YVTN family beta-propeller protein